METNEDAVIIPTIQLNEGSGFLLCQQIGMNLIIKDNLVQHALSP